MAPGLQCPTVEAIELLLDMTYKVMNGGAIQSNRIESINRIIKDLIPRRGLKNATQVSHYLNTHLSYWSHKIDQPTKNPVIETPLTPSTGFARVLTFFRPKADAITITTTF